MNSLKNLTVSPSGHWAIPSRGWQAELLARLALNITRTLHPEWIGWVVSCYPSIDIAAAAGKIY